MKIYIPTLICPGPWLFAIDQRSRVRRKSRKAKICVQNLAKNGIRVLMRDGANLNKNEQILHARPATVLLLLARQAPG